MSAVNSTMLELGTGAPAFALPDDSPEAMARDAVLAGKPVDPAQKPSMGCNIKWKPGNEPEYFKLG